MYETCGVTTRVKCKSIYHLRDILLPLILRTTQVLVPLVVYTVF